MKRLYAPWRSAYTKQANKTKNMNTSSDTCAFCTQLAADNDDQFFVLKRYTHCAVMLNTFPYNAGHLLIIPYNHVALLHALSQEERTDCMNAIAKATEIVTQVLSPEGFNVGINLGVAAGASVPSHLHIHVVPRWQGDTNFLPILGDTKQISVDLHRTFTDLKAGFNT
jgi:ATP adenylyltransferase